MKTLIPLLLAALVVAAGTPASASPVGDECHQYHDEPTDNPADYRACKEARRDGRSKT